MLDGCRTTVATRLPFMSSRISTTNVPRVLICGIVRCNAATTLRAKSSFSPERVIPAGREMLPVPVPIVALNDAVGGEVGCDRSSLATCCWGGARGFGGACGGIGFASTGFSAGFFGGVSALVAASDFAGGIVSVGFVSVGLASVGVAATLGAASAVSSSVGTGAAASGANVGFNASAGVVASRAAVGGGGSAACAAAGGGGGGDGAAGVRGATGCATGFDCGVGWGGGGVAEPAASSATAANDFGSGNDTISTLIALSSPPGAPSRRGSTAANPTTNIAWMSVTSASQAMNRRSSRRDAGRRAIGPSAAKVPPLMDETLAKLADAGRAIDAADEPAPSNAAASRAATVDGCMSKEANWGSDCPAKRPGPVPVTTWPGFEFRRRPIIQRVYRTAAN